MEDEELRRFKTEIDLRDFAASYGFVRDEKESSKGVDMMRSGGEKIAVKWAPDSLKGFEIWKYCNNSNADDNGTIIDFLKNRGGGSLGNIRKTLRNWCGGDRPEIKRGLFAPLVSVPTDTKLVLLEWEKAKFRAAVPYLVSRGLAVTLTGSPRFAGKYRVDWRGNVLFPHRNLEGLCGFEIKNHNFTGFSKHGVKGLWSSVCFKEDQNLVITESAIDGLSHAALFPDPSARYVSIGGSMSPEQLELLRLAMAKMEGKVFLAFDNDQGGDRLADQVKAVAPVGAQIVRLRPVRKDWNEDMKAKLGLE